MVDPCAYMRQGLTVGSADLISLNQAVIYKRLQDFLDAL
jgi:hypothetical protein